MNKATRGLMLVAGALAILTGLLSNGAQQADAANGYEQWYEKSADGCFYYWDGFQDTAAACVRADIGFDYYVASYGSWTYVFSFGSHASGHTWLVVADGNWLIGNPNGSLYSTSYSTGSGFGQLIDFSNPNVAAAMENPVIAGMLIRMQDSYSEMISTVIG